MSLKHITGVLLAIAISSSPVLACKGQSVLFADDFTKADPAWNTEWGEFAVREGKAHVKSESGKIAMVWYEGDFFPGADVCVDVVSPNAKDSNVVLGGLMLQPAGGGMTALYVRPDGFAGVVHHVGNYWLNPVSARKIDSVRKGANAVNTLRLVWKPNDDVVSAFINDNPFFEFKARPNRNRKIGLYAQTDGSVFQYAKFRATTPPR